MSVVVCDNCRAKNRVPRFRVVARAICGKCGVFLPEPPWILVLRKLRQYWPWLVGALAVVVTLAVLIVRQDISPQRVTAREPAWEPAHTATSTSQSSSVLVPEVAKPLAPTSPVITCVPVNVASGAWKIYSGRAGRAPLRITTPPGSNYLIKLVQQGTKRVVLSAYITGGDTKNFTVPLGTYSIFYAQGQIWCGDKEAFGRQNTHLMRLMGDFAFTRDRDGYAGHDIELVPQLQGNLQSQEVSDAEFSELVPAEPESTGTISGKREANPSAR